MPPQAKGAAKDEAKVAQVEAPLPAFEALSEEEVAFCWLSLVDQGKLSAQRLQQFMLEICGERLSSIQVRDLLNYMDANGDGKVGREDFRNFVSVGRLEDTNPADFMWTPKRKYREEHGTVEKQQPKDEDLPSVGVGLTAAASFFRTDTTISENPRASLEILGGAAGLGNVGAGANASTTSSSTAAAGPPEPTHRAAGSVLQTQDTKVSEPKPPPGKRRGPAGGRGARTAAAAAAATEADPAVMASAGAERQEASVVEKPKPSPIPKLDAKVRAQIEASIEKYEQDSWQKFLKVEEEFKEKLFKQFASSADSMSVTEYHKMLMKWHRMARWSMPGDLRPADSLAALRYVLSRERNAQKGESAQADGTAGGEAQSGSGGGAAAAAAASEAQGGGESGGAAAAAAGGGPDEELELPPDAKLSYKLWVDLLNGKYRPEEHPS
mmetsp:Transcript_130566/g.325771  ORF Transcript_130566/g.325771 Transcript_130566/m.325771 type:complete len:439 (+) Transcript_130566:84-1400(+)